jgi:phospholipid/cholesterol/gamma-HCH transport system substrate-binding protein
MATANRAIEVKVGALILVSIVLLVGFMLLLGDFRLAPQAVVHVDLPHSGDLKEGAPVRITGVAVGKVSEVTLWGGRPDPARENRAVNVRVTLKISPHAMRMIHEDARFEVATLGVLGEKYVEVGTGSQGRPFLSEGAVVDGFVPARLDTVAGQAGSLVGKVEDFLDKHGDEVGEAIVEARNLLRHLDEVVVQNRDKASKTLDRLDAVASALEAAIGDGQDARRALVAGRSFLERLDRDVGPALPEARKAVAKIAPLADDATALVADLRALVASARKDVEGSLAETRAILATARDPRGSIGALLNDRELYDDVVALVKDLKRHPWKILFKE